MVKLIFLGPYENMDSPWGYLILDEDENEFEENGGTLIEGMEGGFVDIEEILRYILGSIDRYTAILKSGEVPDDDEDWLTHLEMYDCDHEDDEPEPTKELFLEHVRERLAAYKEAINHPFIDELGEYSA